jgi:hypothetical protein
MAGLFVQQAVRGARQRLTRETCREVLSDFASGSSGLPLSTLLTDMGGKPEEHLDTLVFEDGSQDPACTIGKASPDSIKGRGVVYVVPRAFARSRS